MKIRLVLAITYVLFSMTSGIEIFGMKEDEDNNSDLLINNVCNEINTSSNMRQSFQKFKPMHSNSNRNIFELQEKSYDFIKNTQPFPIVSTKNKLFFYLLKRVNCIYEGSLGITLFEILASFGISIVNNIFGFEKMVKNKFYASMFLLKFGFKLCIPNLSFIIVDVNICIYNWLLSGIKYLMVHYNKAPLKQLGIQWETKSFKKFSKIIYPLNFFNIDIKLNLFGLSLCIPLTKIVEALLISKLMQEADYKKNTKSLYTSIKNMGKIYQAVYNTVEERYEETENIMEKITKASEEGLATLKEISTKAKDTLLPEKFLNNNIQEGNDNNIINEENNNILINNDKNNILNNNRGNNY